MRGGLIRDAKGLCMRWNNVGTGSGSVSLRMDPDSVPA